MTGLLLQRSVGHWFGRPGGGPRRNAEKRGRACVFSDNLARFRERSFYFHLRHSSPSFILFFSAIVRGMQRFRQLGRCKARSILFQKREVFYEGNGHKTILLAFEDITERRAADQQMQQLLRQKELLVEEMQHRIAIASRSSPAFSC
jgi:hypothetical protein